MIACIRRFPALVPSLAGALVGLLVATLCPACRIALVSTWPPLRSRSSRASRSTAG
ncbi:hypothetical protein ATK36_3180 [Amycolatopsis sulphurea]|uniref:Uncharacterized protein n=1 Tax=Amycolatopsis sulphurea TaxID=76022 RepID=A0A2A9FBD1_9PSEU|nr:hypothetical protein ATK36_3180 [Amycolatopsis sulphurea]